MKNIKLLNNVLPIIFDNKRLTLISFNDIEWYISNCRKAYYEEYLDFKFSKDITKDKLRETLYNLVVSYRLNIKSYGEARLLLRDIYNNEIYGGCTIFERENSTIEIAYFIIPKYQGKGIGKKMLFNLCKALANSSIQFNKITLIIRYDNYNSLALAKSVGFKKLSEFQGKYKKNIIMYISKDSLNDSQQV